MTSKKDILTILQDVRDPELPVLSILDLGILRDIKFNDGQVEIVITPTYSGCPAIDTISMDIRLKLLEHNHKNIKITHVLSPAWTTDWMSETGKEKLKAYGVAPPSLKQVVCDTELFSREEAIECPRCNSYHTQMVSRFGSTACKALYQCQDCKEPFDYFKCH